MADFPIYRLVKGSTLTFTEMDDNLRWLSQNMSGSIVTITGSVIGMSGSVNITGDVQISGTASIGFIKSEGYSTGSNQLGDDTSDRQTLIGTVSVSGSMNVSGSTVINNLTGSLFGTSSWAQNVTTASYVLNALSASYALSASFANNATTASYVLNALSASFASTASIAISSSYAYTASSAISAYTASSAVSSSYAYTASSAISAYTASSSVSASYAYTASSSVSSSYAYTASSAVSSSYAYTASSAISAYTASSSVSSSYAITASHAESLKIGLNLSASNISVSNSIQTQYISALSASFGYVQTISGSAVIIGQEYIILNTQTPAARYAGLLIYDSGSSTTTASLVWDSQTNHFVYQSSSGSNYGGGGFIAGPRNSGSLDQVSYPTLNRVVRGQGGDHIYDSNIIDDDSKVSISIPLAVTGSITATTGFTGSLFGTSSQAISASWAPSSGGTTLNGSGYVSMSGTTVAYVSAIPNSSLANSAITIQGSVTSLGGSVNVINGTGFVKSTGTTITYDNSTYYLASNPSGYTSNTGTVTSIGGTGTVSGISLSGTVTSSGSLTLGGTLSVLPSNFASQTANTVLAAPNGSAGAPTFRSLVSADIPSLSYQAPLSGTGFVKISGTTISYDNNTYYSASNPSGYTSNTGTLTSVTVTAGTGMSGGGTLTGAGGTVTLTNAAPDQVVALSSGTGISATGTYPNFTITNTAPDQTVALSNGTGISVTGTYPNFTIASTVTDTNIYNSNGSLSGNRVITGGSNSLTFSGTNGFIVTGSATNEVMKLTSVEPYLVIQAEGATNAASIFLKPSTSAQNGTIQNRSGGGLEFYVGAVPSVAMIIGSNSNVAIGNISPSNENRLEVSGSVKINKVVTNSNPTPTLSITGSFNTVGEATALDIDIFNNLSSTASLIHAKQDGFSIFRVSNTATYIASELQVDNNIFINSPGAYLHLNDTVSSNKGYFIQTNASTFSIIEDQTYQGLSLDPLANLSVGGNITASLNLVSLNGGVKTSAPSGRTAETWKLGDVTAGTITPDTYITIEINGQVYSIPALQGLP